MGHLSPKGGTGDAWYRYFLASTHE